MSSLIAGRTTVFLGHITLASVVARCERANVTSLLMGTYKLASLLQAGGSGRNKAARLYGRRNRELEGSWTPAKGASRRADE